MPRVGSLTLYALASTAMVGALAYQTYLQRRQFYPTVIHLTSSKLSLLVLGNEVLVLMQITLEGQSAEMLAEFEAAAAKIPQVLACFLIAGESDYILRVAARDVGDFGRLHAEKLSALPHVLRMESSFVMREVFTRSLAPPTS